MNICRDPADLPDLSHRVVGLLTQIPAGQVTTYGDLARALGDVVASRWVGHFMLSHVHSPECACHRVVRANGELGAYITGAPEDKARRLESDGIRVQQGRVELASIRYVGLKCDEPLRNLKEMQASLSMQLSLSDRLPQQTVAGVDVSYQQNQGVAAYAEVDVITGELSWSMTVQAPIRFPYISSYLAFRELPLLLGLLDNVGRRHPLADVLMVDGSGIAHPRRAGIATMLGIAADHPTIGITKKPLRGRANLCDLTYGDSRPITEDESILGFAALPSARASRPIFLSPGHLVSVDNALLIVERFLGRRKLPTPIYWADRISRDHARIIISS